ncbi:MAG: glycosyltransferase family 4 protein, partial [Anaerolineae bacterium]|nr:glycosyltransferase family 4 protein [Anaerolineae bacterium]
ENRPLQEKYGGPLAYILRFLLRPILTYARFIIYLNTGAFRNLQWAGVDTRKLQRLMYGTWGVNLSEFTPRQLDQECTDQATKTILYVGRLHQQKGVFDLLRAFDKVSEQRADARLVLIGDGPDRESIVSQINNHSWRRSVLLLGTVKNRDLPAHFQAAAVFVAPSVATKRWEEQVGMTNIQAMACGVPVVSTHSGAIPEYVPDGEAGILVPERDPEALAAAILRILEDDELRARLGRQGRAYAVKHYDARQNVMKAEQIILSHCVANEDLH